jgi:hypothetical protein
MEDKVTHDELREIDEGRTVSHETLERDLAMWLEQIERSSKDESAGQT